MAFILFFPTMVAGPIKRYQNFLPTLREPSLEWAGDWQIGITRILVGLAKKFAIADLMTAFTNHLNHADIAAAQRWVLPIWLLAYGMKIYFDFSAYSDIAIGSARLFGMKVPENFDWPYARTNIAEFWKHWHISLYRWLVDYVFIPLGGSRCKPPRVLVNLLLTMFLSGLWHGAGLNFIVWGLWHGMLLAVHRTWSRWRGPRTTPPSTFGTLCRLGAHFRHRQPRLGLLLHGPAHRRIFPQTPVWRLKFMETIENTKSNIERETAAPPSSTLDVSRLNQGSLFEVFPFLGRLKNIFDYLGGSREESAHSVPPFTALVWPLVGSARRIDPVILRPDFKIHLHRFLR